MTPTPMPELRMRTSIHPDELAAKEGRVVTDGDFNVVLTGPARVLKPDGTLLAVYLPGVLAADMAPSWSVLSSIRLMTDNRGKASGTPRVQRGEQKRTRTRRIASATIGSVDPGPSTGRATGRLPVCRMTAWTAKNAEGWMQLGPLLRTIAGYFQAEVPDRYAVQAAAAAGLADGWTVPGTPFTTVTVNNTYSTGVHTDSGDLETGFSTLAVARRGTYTGGHLVLARYRVAVDMRDGDLLLFDAHEPHGNTAMHCPHQAKPLAKWCTEGCERVSLVSYFRTAMSRCDTPAAEQAKAVAAADRVASRS